MITYRNANQFFSPFYVFAAESVRLVHDFGNMFEKFVAPAVSEDAETLLDSVLMFVRYYETNETFDLLTHGMGPGLVAVVMHNFSQFLGDLMGQKLDHATQYHGKRLFPNMYMDKLRNIINSIVVDRADEYTGKLVKGQESDNKSDTKKKKPSKKHHQQAEKLKFVIEDSDSEEIEVLTDSCSDNEKDFTTLTSSTGTAYHPPSKTTTKSRYGKRGGDDDIIKRIEMMQHTLQEQKKQINKLTTENSEAKDKLKKLRAHKKPLKQSNLKTFVNIPSVDVDSSDDDALDEDHKIPDSTQPTKDTLDNVATGSDAGSVFQCSGVVHKQKKRARIDSESTVKQTDMPTAMSEESESEIDKLVRTKLEMEQKLKDAQNKLLQQKMEAKARTFQDQVICAIRNLRATLMECYGTAKTDERLVAARSKFCEEVETILVLGYTFCTGEDFVGRVERSILAGQTPEQQFICTRTDNSEADPILGDVTDIIYEVSMPVIVKRELTDDDDADCDIISVQPAPRDFIPKDVTVKQEKIDPKYDNLDKNGNPVAETEEKNEENSQAHEEEAAEGDTEETKDAAAENTPKKPRKNAKKKPSVAPAARRILQSKKSNV